MLERSFAALDGFKQCCDQILSGHERRDGTGCLECSSFYIARSNLDCANLRSLVVRKSSPTLAKPYSVCTYIGDFEKDWGLQFFQACDFNINSAAWTIYIKSGWCDLDIQEERRGPPDG